MNDEPDNLTAEQLVLLNSFYGGPALRKLDADLLDLVRLKLLYTINRPREYILGQYYEFWLPPKATKYLNIPPAQHYDELPEYEGNSLLEAHAKKQGHRPTFIRLRDDNDRVWWYEETGRDWSVMFHDRKGDGFFKRFRTAYEAQMCCNEQRRDERKRQKKIRGEF